MNCAEQEVDVILRTGIALSKEKDRNQLLNMILTQSMKIADCDAGILYILVDNALHFKIRKTISMNVDQGGDGAEITLPPVPLTEKNVCAYAAIKKVSMNIADVYADTTFDFSGLCRYDNMTGYHSVSLLTVPLVNQEDEVVGVMQLINALDGQGGYCPFAKKNEQIISALASQAAIAVSNMRYLQEMKAQMWSFTQAMAEAIDNRTPYNANHVRKVAEYTGLLADYINELHKKGKEEIYFNENRREQLVMAAWLHDIGKMIIPTKVMNKATRLEGHEKDVLQRFELIRAKLKILWLEKKISEQEYLEKTSQLNDIGQLVQQADSAGVVDDETAEKLREYLDLVYEDENGTLAYFTEEEKACLLIQRGTLSAEERKIMESHVEMTERILSKVHFNSYFSECAVWAVQHHECLNGGGYPRGLKAEELSVEARIIAVADICDALLATDRPYKKPMPKDKAFAVMKEMAEQGSIDGKLVKYMEQCI